MLSLIDYSTSQSRKRFFFPNNNEKRMKTKRKENFHSNHSGKGQALNGTSYESYTVYDIHT